MSGQGNETIRCVLQRSGGMHQRSQVWLRVECVEVQWLLYQPREIADFGRRALGVRRRITEMIDGQTVKISPPLGGRRN